LAASPRETLSPRALRVLLLSSLCSFQASLNLSIMNVAFPDLQKAFPDVSRAHLSWVINTYTIVAAAVLVPLGIVADRVGRKRVTLAGLATFTTGSVLGALAPSVPVLIVARTLQALGASATAPASVALMLDEVPMSRRTFAVAVWSGIGSAAAAAGPSLGAVLIDAGGWRWAFWTTAPIGLLCLALGARIFRESKAATAPEIPDVASAAFLMIGVAALTLGVIQSRSWGWTSGRTLGAVAVAVVLLGGLFVRSGRVRNPLVNLELFRFGSFRQAAAGTVFFGIGFFALFFGSFQFLTFVWGYSITEAGLLFLLVPSAIAVMSPVAARLTDRFGHGAMLTTAGVLFMGGASFLATSLGDRPDLTVWFVGLGIIGLAGSLAWPAIFGLVVLGIPPYLFAVATGVNQTFQRVATVLGVALTITLTDSWRAGDGVGVYARMWWLMVGAGGAAVLVGLWRPRSNTSTAVEPAVQLGGVNP
jgi:EmrB/QacA subfamily drug resistance transporter